MKQLMVKMYLQTVGNSTTEIHIAKPLSNEKCTSISTGYEGVYGGVAVWLLSLPYTPAKAQRLNSRFAATFVFNDKPIPSAGNIRLCIAFHQAVTLTHKRNITYIIY
jgi:hypothetical protein